MLCIVWKETRRCAIPFTKKPVVGKVAVSRLKGTAPRDPPTLCPFTYVTSFSATMPSGRAGALCAYLKAVSWAAVRVNVRRYHAVALTYINENGG